LGREEAHVSMILWSRTQWTEEEEKQLRQPGFSRRPASVQPLLQGPGPRGIAPGRCADGAGALSESLNERPTCDTGSGGGYGVLGARIEWRSDPGTHNNSTKGRLETRTLTSGPSLGASAAPVSADFVFSPSDPLIQWHATTASRLLTMMRRNPAVNACHCREGRI
jgi:hypothetical protein